MINFEYAARHIRGVWRIAFGGGDWREDMDLSVDGVFRSFWAMAFTAPFMLLAFVSIRRTAAQSEILASDPLQNAPSAFVLTIESLGFVADWALSVVALVALARTMKAENRVADVIVSYNWAQVMTAAAVSIPFALVAIAGSESAAGLLTLPAVVFSIFITWRVLRECLSLDVTMTVATIAVLTLISLVVSAALSGIALSLLQLFS